MFSSDQRFMISGDRKENLKETLRCALLLGGNLTNRDNHATNIGSFCIHPVHGLVFGNRYSDEKSDLFVKYPMPVTLDMAVEHALQYLQTPEAQEIRIVQPHDDGDGSIYEGWEVYLPDFAYFRRIIAVKPSWTYYSK